MMRTLYLVVIFVGFMLTALFVAIGGLLGPPSTWLDCIVPDDALRGFAHVGWRKVDDRHREAALRVAGGLCLPLGILDWYVTHGWQRWPGMMDLLPVVTAPREVIDYRFVTREPVTRNRARG